MSRLHECARRMGVDPVDGWNDPRPDLEIAHDCFIAIHRGRKRVVVYYGLDDEYVSKRGRVEVMVYVVDEKPPMWEEADSFIEAVIALCERVP